MAQMSYKFLTSLFTMSLIIGVVESLIRLVLRAYQEAGGVLTELQEMTLDTLLLVLISTPILWFVVLRLDRAHKTTLQQSRLNAELRTALNAHALVSIADAQGLIIYANDNFCQACGYSLEELVGKNHHIVSSGHHDAEYIRTMWQTITQGQIWQGVFCNHNKNGERYWLESTIAPLLDDIGKPYQYVSICQNITARKIANEKLIMLKQALDACSEMILISNNQGMIQYANPAMCQITGWPEAMLIGKKPKILDSPHADKQTVDNIRKALSNHESWTGRLLVRRKGVRTIRSKIKTSQLDALEFWAELSITPVLNKDETLAGYVQIQRDITEKISKEAALAIEKQDTAARLAIAKVLQQVAPLQNRLTDVLDILFKLKAFNLQHKGGVFLRSENHDYLKMFVSRGEFSEQFICREKQVALGECLCGRVAVSKELLVSNDCFCDPRHDRQFDRMQKSHGHYIIPLNVENDTIGVLFLYTDPYPVQNKSRLTMLKQVAEMVGLAVLKERVKVSLEKARDMAMQTALAKSEFLAHMSHEIRTPMSGVLGMLDLLRDTNLSSQQWDLLNTAYAAAEALLAILNDILDFSKLEAGKLEIEKISFNLTELLEDICALQASPAHVKGLEFNSFIPADLPKHWQGDPNRIRQVLTNLISNAVKFTQQGEISIAVSHFRHPNGVDILRFEVRDTGLGIAPDVQTYLFKPFSQAETTTARRFGGTGLGLSICKDLIELMGGEIGLESKLDEGSLFWFTLPLTAVEMSKTYAPVFDNIGKRVLVIDDNATNRTILDHYLNHWGFLVGQAANGRAALQELENAVEQNAPYHLAVLDMNMPEMDGISLARIISESPTLSKTPRILLSSSRLLGEIERQSLGLTQCLLKPIRQTLLFNAITHALNDSVQHETIKRKTETATANYHDKKLLLVEDNKLNQKVILGILEKFHLMPDVADNGQLALEKLAQNSYELILMDCQMPILDGYQTTLKLREFEVAFDKKHQPVIALTAHAIAGEREKCLAIGMDDYLTKPVSQHSLGKVLAHWLGAVTSKDPLSTTIETAEAITTDSVWDKEAALDGLGNDEALLKAIIDVFIAETPKQILELKTALESQNLPELADLAHAIKGSVSFFCAENAGHCAANLETAARLGKQSEDYSQWMVDLNQALQDLMLSFQNYLTDNSK